MSLPDAVCDCLEPCIDRALEELMELARIPSVSAEGFDPREVRRSAEAVAELLEGAGFEDVAILGVAGAHPAVMADWRGAGAQAPTALVYAHHDVQPPGRAAHWKTPPFEPTLCPDGRIYGRGVVDDKAGLMLHLAALRAWIQGAGGPPLNLKLLVEGEEEIGSTHLSEFLRAHRSRLQADVLVLSDTANLETGLPSLTVSLRGLVVVDVTVRALDHPIHSGMWGGPVSDAATALSRLLARLVDDAGVIQVPGLLADVPELSPALSAELAALPFDEATFRAEAGLPAAAPFAGEAERSVYERLWTRPSLAVTALEAVSLAESANQLVAEAKARIGLRLPPGMDAERACAQLRDFLASDPPLGVEVETRADTAVPGWRTEPVGPAFDAARRALAAGFGRESVSIGCGGTIPFVGPFAEVLGGIPALLLGLEDPACNAHGENESLHVGDFRKAARASAHLWPELAKALAR